MSFLFCIRLSPRDTDLVRQIWHSVRQFVHVFLRLESGGKAKHLCIFSFNFSVIKSVMSVSDSLIEGSALCCCEIIIVLSRGRRVASTKQNVSQASFYQSQVWRGWRNEKESKRFLEARMGTAIWSPGWRSLSLSLFRSQKSSHQSS